MKEELIYEQTNVHAENMKEVATYLIDNSLLPASFYKDKDGKLLPLKVSVPQVIQGIQVSISMGFKLYGDIIRALQNMFPMHGKIHLWGDLPLNLAKRDGEVIRFEEFFLNANGKKICVENGNSFDQPEAAVCIVQRKGETHPIETCVSAKDLELSGGKRNEDGSWSFRKSKKSAFDSQTWLQYPKRHWMYRARRYALSVAFPDKIGCTISDPPDFALQYANEKERYTSVKGELNEIKKLLLKSKERVDVKEDTGRQFEEVIQKEEPFSPN